VVSMIRLSLPLGPSANHFYIHTRTGTRLTPEAKAYRLEVWAMVMQQTTPEEREVLKGDLVLFVWVHWPDKRRRDLDNIAKNLLDSIAPALGIDDSQFKALHVEEDRDPLAPAVRVAVHTRE
jgi:Holliday junction resolvase RusA-like endonuclease